MARAQGSQTSAKEDTRYLSLSSTPATDLSQYLTNLTASGAGAYEANSTRSQITTARTVSVRWTATAAEASVVLMVHGNNAQTDFTWGLATTAGGYFCAHQNGVILWTSAAATAAKDYTFSWAMRDNPDTTGASDAKISEVVLYNHTDTTLVEMVQFTHVVATSSAAWTLSVGGWWNGAALTNVPTNAPSKARISASYHPNVEVLEDWIGARTAYAGDADDGPAEPVGPVSVASTLGDSPYFVGRPNIGYAAAHNLAVARRPWSPLVNDVYSDAPPLTQTPAPTQWAKLAPSSAYSMMLQYLRWAPVPAGSTHAWVRVHVVSYVTAGAAVPVGVRVYALNYVPGVSDIPAQAPALEVYHVGEVLTVDDGSAAGTGQWLELGYLRLPKFAGLASGWSDTVHLAVAYDVDPAGASANDANARLVIDAVHARAAYRTGVGVFDP
jgi:hypothetical protein